MARNQKKGGIAFSPTGVDTHLTELHLSREERKVLEMRFYKKSFAEIAEQLFKGKRTRQAVQQIAQRAKQRQWRLDAKKRYAEKPGDCPVNEAPLPSRVRRALVRKGITRLGQLVNFTTGEMEKLEGLGKQGAWYIPRLLTAWGITKNATFCPECGAQVGARRRDNKFEVACKQCGAECKVSFSKRADEKRDEKQAA